tara:strand:+ start:57 stop:719 length:663 start_codon:yes stop_codon:yes gene_type:complete
MANAKTKTAVKTATRANTDMQVADQADALKAINSTLKADMGERMGDVTFHLDSASASKKLANVARFELFKSQAIAIALMRFEHPTRAKKAVPADVAQVMESAPSKTWAEQQGAAMFRKVYQDAIKSLIDAGTPFAKLADEFGKWLAENKIDTWQKAHAFQKPEPVAEAGEGEGEAGEGEGADVAPIAVTVTVELVTDFYNQLSEDDQVTFLQNVGAISAD